MWIDGMRTALVNAVVLCVSFLLIPMTRQVAGIFDCTSGRDLLLAPMSPVVELGSGSIGGLEGPCEHQPLRWYWKARLDSCTECMQTEQAVFAAIFALVSAGLVRAALASMQQLRSHLTFTLAGLRIHQSKGEHATMPWKRSAGIITPGGDPMLVQFVPPLHKSIAEQGGSARQPDYLYAQEDSATLPPVQIQPPVQLPPSETWHSDTPPDPMLPSNKLGRSVDMHRWGANVRPPLIANPGRAPSARRSPRVASARATKQAAKWQQGEIARPRTALSLGLKSVADTEPLLHRWGGDSSEHGAGSSRGDSLANLQACAASST